MTARRMLLATTVVFGLLASAPASGAETFRLDGRKAKVKHWKATLAEASVPLFAATRDPLTPTLEDCTAQSCDIHELRLTLPKGVSGGIFRVAVTVPRELQAAVVLYDSKGDPIQSRDGTLPGDFEQNCCDEADYTMEILIERLRAGTYTLAVHDRAGAGSFEATVEWVAKPPDRGYNVGR